MRGLFEKLENVLFHGVGWDGNQKCPLILFILCTYADKVTNINCNQHSYGYQNLMLSWGLGNKISKLEQVGDFSIFGSKPFL